MYIRSYWFGIVNGQISSVSDSVICQPHIIFLFSDDNLSKYQSIFTDLDMCIDIMETWFGIAIGPISSIFELSACTGPNFLFRMIT